MNNFEVVSFSPPSVIKKTKFNELHLELAQMLLKVPAGKSIRRGYSSYKEACAYRVSLVSFLKKQKLSDTYFTSCMNYAEGDGKFYVYIGKRSESE